MGDYVLSLIRTWVPTAVGAFLSWLASVGLGVGEDAGKGLTVFLAALFIAVYYALVRALETRWPALGKLLGASRAPVYQPPTPEAVRTVRGY